MCTVTLVYSGNNKNDFTLTSNRDEGESRITLAPQKHQYKEVEIFCPTDAVAGGTWIGFSELNRAVCLLNGEFKMHKRQEVYKKSRGVVVKDFLVSPKLDDDILNYELDEIEPFTMIILNWQKELLVTELVWDGYIRHISNLPKDPQIWSASPLFTREMKAMRENWFMEYLENQEPSASGLWEFHNTAGIGDKHVDFIMDRKFVKTQSITQIEKDTHQIKMRYLDLQENEISEKAFSDLI